MTLFQRSAFREVQGWVLFAADVATANTANLKVKEAALMTSMILDYFAFAFSA